MLKPEATGLESHFFERVAVVRLETSRRPEAGTHLTHFNGERFLGPQGETT